MTTRMVLLLGAFSILLPTSLGAADWPQFRNTNCRSIAEGTGYPLKWDKENNIRWRVELPEPANSSPIVSAGHVFVTTGGDNGKSRSLHCFDRKDGKLLWTKTVDVTIDEPTHKTNPYSASTPVADGERVIVWHGSAGLFCYDFSGKELWKKDLGSFIHIWGYGSSPILHGDMLFLHCGPGERTFLIAVDKQTGETIWQIDEPGGESGLESAPDKKARWIGSWSTPVLATIADKVQLIVSFPHHVKSFEPDTGLLLWRTEGLGDLVYTSVVFDDINAVAMSGYHGPAIGFRIAADASQTSPTLLWRHSEKVPQRIGSGVIVNGRLFMANADAGTMQCFEVTTGEERWRDRMPSPAACWGSLVQAGDRLYVTNQKGHTIVMAANTEKLEVLAVNSLGEYTNSTPAFSDGEIFLRTYDALYCIGGTPE